MEPAMILLIIAFATVAFGLVVHISIDHYARKKAEAMLFVSSRIFKAVAESAETFIKEFDSRKKHSAE